MDNIAACAFLVQHRDMQADDIPLSQLSHDGVEFDKKTPLLPALPPSSLPNFADSIARMLQKSMLLVLSYAVSHVESAIFGYSHTAASHCAEIQQLRRMCCAAIQ